MSPVYLFIQIQILIGFQPNRFVTKYSRLAANFQNISVNLMTFGQLSVAQMQNLGPIYKTKNVYSLMFMLSSFRDLMQVSGFIDIPVSFTILNHHLIGNISV
jgi:hypothetical protein